MNQFEDDIIMPFGKYAGEYICDIPIKYLEWLERNYDLRTDIKAAVEKAIDDYYARR